MALSDAEWFDAAFKDTLAQLKALTTRVAALERRLDALATLPLVPPAPPASAPPDPGPAANALQAPGRPRCMKCREVAVSRVRHRSLFGWVVSLVCPTHLNWLVGSLAGQRALEAESLDVALETTEATAGGGESASPDAATPDPSRV